MIIGIDPDHDKNGVAVYKSKSDFKLDNLRFFELFDFLKNNRESIKKTYIEAGWLNTKSNFRFSEGSGLNARIGAKVGANHETGKKIVEMCEYIGVPFETVKPLKKHWKGGGGKISHEEFIQVTNVNIKRSNQEQRDALLLVWGR